MHTIRSVAVLGAGTMGAQIAAQVANAGWPVLLLDLDADTAARGLKHAAALKPDPFFTRDVRPRIRLGGFDTDLPAIAGCDWIVEAVVERLDAKRALLERVEACRRTDAIVSSNTSGIPIAAIAEGRSPAFRRRWLGTHFFNPPRYLRLVEVIPTPDTDAAAVAEVSSFVNRQLGRGVVVARDAPGFIGNRIGLHGVASALVQLADGGYTIEEIDAMTGPAIGRPKSATFRTMDIAGVDILAHVAGDLVARLDPEERQAFELPPLVGDLVRRGWLGEKAGRGFYRKERGAGGSTILTLDPATMEYRPRRPPKLGALETARAIEDPAERIRTLFLARDRVGGFLRATLGRTLLYSAEVAAEVAHSPDDVDRALRWGFGWALGPFELLDAIGVDAVLDACAPAKGTDLSPAARGWAGLAPRPAAPDSTAAGPYRAPAAGRAGPSDSDRRGAAGRDRQAEPRGESGRRRRRGARGRVPFEAQHHRRRHRADAGGWSDRGVRTVRGACGRQRRRRFLRRRQPHAGAAGGAGRQLGRDRPDGPQLPERGHRAAVLAGAGGRRAGRPRPRRRLRDRAPRRPRAGRGRDLHGQAEVGVGLIPAGCGTKELTVRAIDATMPGTDPLPGLRRAFETIGFGKVSTSAAHARQLGLMRDVDGVTMDRERLMDDAKAVALGRVRAGYRAPEPRTAIPVGGGEARAALELGIHLAWRGGAISDHDARIGRALARIMTGGDLPHTTTVTERAPAGPRARGVPRPVR